MATYTYDAAGNRANDNGWVQTYNNAGRLIQSVKGSTTITYSYNALGQRVRKIAPTRSTNFVYDTAGHLIGEYYADGTLIQETVWLGDTPVAVVKPTADPLKPSISYIWADHLGTPRQITNPTNKQILWRWDGEPFGADLESSNPSGQGYFSYNLRFPGQYFDQETGKHYNYYRDYDPATGRYVQSDPIGLGGGINTYAYVEGDPLNAIDPRGLIKVITVDPKKNSNDAIIYQGALNHQSNPDNCNVYAHGNPNLIMYEKTSTSKAISPKQLSKLLKEKGCEPKQTVVLHSCRTGQGDNSFAERFAKEWDGPVIAPNKKLWFSSNGPENVPYGKTPDGKRNGDDPGVWVTFQ